MKKFYLKIIFFTIAGLITLGTYCDISELNKGSLSLTLNYYKNKQNDNTRTNSQASNETISAYEVFLSGPNGEKLSIAADNNGLVVIDDLIFGEWLISVTAMNSKNIPVGSGNVAVQILPKRTVDYKILISPYNEIGYLRLIITWESKPDESSLLKCSLDPFIGSAPAINFTLNGGRSSYKSISIPSGYYFLTVKFVKNGVECKDAVEAVRITPNETAIASLQVVASPSNGGTALFLDQQITDSFEIIFKGPVKIIKEGEWFKITAEPVNTREVIYSWFIDGALKASGLNLTSLTIPDNLNKGRHRLDVIIYTLDGFHGGSKKHFFEVI